MCYSVYSATSRGGSGRKDEGLIDYTRGHIQILNRQGLEAKACECYEVIREEYERLYGDLAGRGE
jgi:hypothetical protein